MVLTVPCAKCHKKVPTNQVRLQADKSYVCYSCAGYAPGSGENMPFSVDHEEKPRLKMQYQCLKCKYVFFLKEGFAKKCPYCNGERIEARKGDAQKLIDLHAPMRDD